MHGPRSMPYLASSTTKTKTRGATPFPSHRMCARVIVLFFDATPLRLAAVQTAKTFFILFLVNMLLPSNFDASSRSLDMPSFKTSLSLPVRPVADRSGIILYSSVSTASHLAAPPFSILFATCTRQNLLACLRSLRSCYVEAASYLDRLRPGERVFSYVRSSWMRTLPFSHHAH